MKAIVKENCIGCGLCESICPMVFQLGEDGQAQVLGDDHAAYKEQVEEAIADCPVAAIEWE